jgi:AraC-like DNA-binding protein
VFLPASALAACLNAEFTSNGGIQNHGSEKAGVGGSTPSLAINLSISHYCGFSSHGHFSNTFRRIVGVAPREYRRNYGLIL